MVTEALKTATPPARGKATAIGVTAVPMWATLPLLTVLAGDIPPLQLVAMTFTLGATLGGVFLLANPEERRGLNRVTASPVIIGVTGLFGFHLAFFLALQNAPAVEASLLDYLWPVLIVVFSTALPRSAGAGRLSIWHVAGALVAFAGACLAVTGGSSLDLSGNVFGYAMALASALIWSSYSVVTRLFAAVPSSAVSLYCAGTAALAWFAHAIAEPTKLPDTPVQTLAILGLGLFPVGAAFYVWDYGCKHGDLRILGVAAYFAPVVSTALLIAAGLSEPRPALWIAAALITAGAVLASRGKSR